MTFNVKTRICEANLISINNYIRFVMKPLLKNKNTIILLQNMTIGIDLKPLNLIDCRLEFGQNC